ncbi:MAG: nucleotidyl transferase AbiEii/AbiGii toxin family protein [Candidatus Micrarchaeia archaeon]
MEEWLTEEQREIQRMQLLLLRELYSISIAPIFKGGTALEMVYGLDRFSEDLDFDADISDIAVFDEAINNLDSKFNMIENDWESDIIRHSNMHIFTLYFNSTKNLRLTIRVDVVLEKPIIAPKRKILNIYGKPVTIIVMDEREILAEKVNAIMNPKRNQPRDLYDLRFLLEKNVQIDFHLIYLKSKSTAFGKVPKYSLKKFEERIDSLGKKWGELKPYLREVPDFDKTKEYVLGVFRLLG